METIGALILRGTSRLGRMSGTPRLDAEVLLSHATGLSRTKLLAQAQATVCAEALLRFESYLARRESFEAVAYITERKEFWGLEFYVDKRVLIPRPETELLLELALKRLEGRDEPLKILDLGTGSGCIAVALAHELLRIKREFSIVAVDISPEALEVAQKNIFRHGLQEMVKPLQGDWFSSLLAGTHAFHLIVTNPPYVAEQSMQAYPDIMHEPRQALVANDYGLADVKHLLNSAGNFLAPEGCFLCEIGDGQAACFRDYSNAKSQHVPASLKWVALHHDLAGKERVIELKKC